MEVSVFNWIQNADGEAEGEVPRLEADEVVVEHGVPRKALMDFLYTEIDKTDALCGLPFTLLLMLSYCIFATLRCSAENVRAVEESLVHDIVENANFAFVSEVMGHKNIDDVNSIADFWSWTSRGFVPLLFIQQWGASEGRDTSVGAYAEASRQPVERGSWLHYNRIVGGVRLRQERSGEGADEAPCSTLETLIPFYGSCVAGLGYEMEPEKSVARMSTDPVMEQWLYIYEDSVVLQNNIWELERAKYFDKHTRKLELTVPVFNAELQIHTLLYVNFFINRGGHIWKLIIPMSTFSNWHPVWYYWMTDIVWILCVAYVFCSELIDIIKTVKRFGVSSIMGSYIGFWNALDWISIVCAFAVLVMLAIAVTQTSALNTTLSEIPDMPAPGEDPQAYVDAVHEHMLVLEESVFHAYNLRLAIFCYPLIIILRLFKAYGANPRLALVTNTLKNAFVDLVHFFIVFTCIMLMFTVSAILFFGREVHSFSFFNRAMLSLSRIVFGDLMWDELRGIGVREAMAWLTIFVTLVTMLLINMFLAIIMDHYVACKGAASENETLLHQAKQTWRRWLAVQTRGVVSFDQLLMALLKEDRERADRLKQKLGDGAELNQKDEDNRIFRPVNLQEVYFMLHGGSLEQKEAMEVLCGAVKMYYIENKRIGDLDEVERLTLQVEYRTNQIYDQMAAQSDGPPPDNVGSMEALSKELCHFTDEMRMETEARLREIEDLRAQKQGLLLQLQLPVELRLPPEDLMGQQGSSGNGGAEGDESWLHSGSAGPSQALGLKRTARTTHPSSSSGSWVPGNGRPDRGRADLQNAELGTSADGGGRPATCEDQPMLDEGCVLTI